MSEKMIITDRVDIPLSAPELFDLITDLDAVVPCVPGAILNQDEAPTDGSRTGQIVIAFGPIRYRYDGTIRARDVDPSTRSVTYEAAATETSGEGTVGGELRLIVVDRGDESTLDVLCEALVTGMVADYGQDMAEEVARDVIRQFANAIRDRYENRRASLLPRDKSTTGPAAPKPIGGLRLLFRVALQRIFRKIRKINRFGSKRNPSPRGRES